MPINRVSHAAVRVHDLEVARRWYTEALGLQELERGGDVCHLSCDGTSVDLVLVAGGQGLQSLSLGVPGGEQLDATEKALRDRGLEVTVRHDQVPGVESVLEHVLPTGHVVQLVLGQEREAGITQREWDGRSATPIDIDHVTIAVPDVESTTRDLIDRFSYKLTEALSPADRWLAAFVRTSDKHHDLGLVASPRPQDTLHHIAFWVGGIAHQEMVADRLSDHGTSIEFGPGKHGGSANQLFMYAFDPSGNRVEFCGSMGSAESDQAVMTTGMDGVGHTLNKWTPGFAPDSFFGRAS